MKIEQRRNFIINTVYFAIMATLIWWAFQFVGNYLMPFLIGFIIAFTLKPLVTKLTKHFGERKTVRITVIILFYIIVALVIMGLFFATIAYFKNLTTQIPEFYNSTLIPAGTQLVKHFETFVSGLSPDISSGFIEISDTIVEKLKVFGGTATAWAVTSVTKTASSIPQMLISVLISIISSFFFTLDYQRIVATVMNAMPKKVSNFIIDFKEGFIGTVGKYIKAYAKLMTLTFIELSIAFSVLGMKNPFGLAFMIAIVDILPVLGTGTVMIPWVIIELVMGKSQMAIALLVVYVFIMVVRNILEPKVVGDQIGLHPLATLILIYVGMRLAGIVGLFGLPILVTILKTLHEQGKIKIFREYFDSIKLTKSKH